MRKAMNEISWLAQELENPTHNLQLGDFLAQAGPIIDMKNDCKQTFSIPDAGINREEELGVAARLDQFLREAVEHTKTGQEGTPIPGDLSLVLSRALEMVFRRFTC